MYTEEQLFKAVRYALQRQKAHDEQVVYDILYLPIMARDTTTTELAFKDVTNTLSTTENTFGSYAMIERKEVLEHIKEGK